MQNVTYLIMSLTLLISYGEKPTDRVKSQTLPKISWESVDRALDYVEMARDNFEDADAISLCVKLKTVCKYCMDNLIPHKKEMFRKPYPMDKKAHC